MTGAFLTGAFFFAGVLFFAVAAGFLAAAGLGAARPEPSRHGPRAHAARWVPASRSVGGLQELVESAAGFGVLDLALLRKLLETYGEKRLWAAAGWFLERHQQRFFVPHEYLASMAPHRPAAPRYLERGRRGGKLFSRWNLIVPPALASAAEPDEA